MRRIVKKSRILNCMFLNERDEVEITVTLCNSSRNGCLHDLGMIFILVLIPVLIKSFFFNSMILI